MKHRIVRTSLALLVGLAIGSCETPTELCEQNPEDLACDGTTVGDTEIWKLELEQLDDGSTSVYPRRGTITMRLRMNRTTQPDPTCEDFPSDQSSVTTFLADVEAFSSRLQGPATGTADGSWNCHGFSATVRLSDGTRYDLVSEYSGTGGGRDTGGGEDADEVEGPAWSWGRAYDVRWTAGARTGAFSLRAARALDFEHIRESHLDVLVQNLTDGEAHVQLRYPAGVSEPLDIEYQIPYPAAVEGTLSVSWPAHAARREPRAPGVAPSAALEGRSAWVWGPSPYDDWRVDCYLEPDHGNQVQLLIHDDGPECGDGWLDAGFFVSAARSPLYIEAGEEAMRDTVTITTTLPDDAPGILTEVWAESQDPGITARIFAGVLTVTAEPDAPLGEHGVRVMGRLYQGANLVFADTIFVPVYVYQLDVSTAAGTLEITAGASDTTSVLLDGAGFFSDIHFRATDVPSAVVDGTPSFLPQVTDRFLGAASLLRVFVDAAAEPGTYGMTVCAMLVLDPLSKCHPAPLTIVVPPSAGACGDFDLSVDFDPIQVAPGASDVVPVFVHRAPGFSGSVQIMLAAGAGGTQVSQVMSDASLDPSYLVFEADPAAADTLTSVLSFTPRPDLAPDTQYELSIAGCAPHLEADPDWHRLPVTFEVIGS